MRRDSRRTNDRYTSRVTLDVPALLRRASARRAHLPGEGTTIYRAAHLTETDGLFTLERIEDIGVLSLYQDLLPARETDLAAACGDTLGLRGVYLKRRPPEARHVANTERALLSPPAPVWGEGREELPTTEHGVPFLIRPGLDLSVGLFSDMRPARAWLRGHARERVLNTFAYTCAFGVNAALGGAAVVKNLDASRKVLAWGQENYALSSLPHPDQDFIYGDVFDWLSRFARRGAEFDQVVLDPPSFARGVGGSWRAEKDYPALVALAARVTGWRGQLLACTNHAGVNERAFEKMVLAGADEAGRTAKVAARLGPGEDYPGATHLKVLVVDLDG